MGAIRMSMGYKSSQLDLPCQFVDKYLSNCIPVYPLIYIWSLKRALDGKTSSVTDICNEFGLTESDVHKAWQHWANKGIVDISFSGDDLSVTFLAEKDWPKNETVKTTEVKSEVIKNEVKSPQTHEPKVIKLPKLESKPHYTNEELAIYKSESTEVSNLFKQGEYALGKFLNHNDMSVIFSFYDWLLLPLEVIEFLFEFCVSNNQRSLRYMEKCAVDWSENSINTLEKAAEYVINFDKNYRTILHHMGISAGYPAPSQRKYMNKWVDEWEFSLDIIIRACEISTDHIEKPKFTYVDKILALWYKKQVKNLKDAESVDLTEMNNVKSKKKTVKPSSKPNRFVNFEQRETDYESLEKLEREYLISSLMVD